MDIRTKFEIGSIVYAVHPCKAVCGGQSVLNGEAAGHAVSLYGESSGGHDWQGEYGSNCMLKEIVCQKLQQALKAVLSYEQLERFGEEFAEATQGLVFREA